MLANLPIISAVLVISSIVLSIHAGRVVERLKKELSGLERRRMDAFKRLAEAQHQREGMQGTLDMLERKKTALLSMQENLNSEQTTLEQEVVPEHDIAEAGKRDDDEADPGPEKEKAKEGKAQPQKKASTEKDQPATREREIKVRIPMRRAKADD